MSVEMPTSKFKERVKMEKSPEIFSSEISTAYEQICRPGNLRGRRISSTVAELTWDEPYSTCSLCPDAQGYEISGDGIATVDILRPPYELRGLSQHIDHRICVRAKAAGSIVSEPSYFDVRKSPGAPDNLHVSERTDTGITLSWSAPVGGEPVFDYLVSHHGQVIASVRGLTCQVSNPTSLTSYDFEVYARSARSNLSDPAVLDLTPPDKPAGLIAINLSSRAAALVWSKPYDNVRVSHYEIWQDGQVIATLEKTVESGLDGYLATGLTPETDYCFAITALDAAGNRSPKSDSIPVRTPVLDPPTNVRAINVTRNAIELAWKRAEGAAGAILYEACVDNHRGSSRRADTLSQSFTFNGLWASSTYTVSVRAQDASQRYSEPVTFEVTTTS